LTRRACLFVIPLAIFAAGVSARSRSDASRSISLGVDVSRLEGKINWRRAAASGIGFAIVEASRGSGSDCTVKPKRCGADPFYAANYAQARDAGIRVGPYHRAFVNGATRRGAIADAKAEADLFAARVGKLNRGDLLPALDVEPPYDGVSASRLRLWVQTWLDRVEGRLGVKPMIYTSASGWQGTGDTTRFARAGHRLWVAHWGVHSPSVPAGDWAGHGWAVWQFTNDRRVPGIKGLPDADRLGVPLAQISVR
jgi:GH25 family lysozyme M1 (1,4-beta-N-acetylmuramidase)